MTYRPFSIGLLSGVLALAPLFALGASAQVYDDFGSSYYDNLYRDIDTFDAPYGNTYYGSTNYDSQYDNYYDYDNSRYTTPSYRTPTYTSTNYNRTNYRQNYTMPNFRCYYWGRDGSCMNYTYKQAPSYYTYPYNYGNYGNTYGNYYGNYSYPYYGY